MNKRSRIVGISAALCLSAVLLSSVAVSAHGIGWGRSHTAHLANLVGANLRQHRYYRPSSAYAPYFGIPGYGVESTGSVAAVQSPAPLIAPTFALSCHHNRETVTVPAEGGGERKITITHC